MIHIEGDYYIDADEHCYSLLQRRVAGPNAKEPGKEYFSTLESYHTTVPDAFRAYVSRMQRRCVAEEAMDIRAAIKALEAIQGRAERLLDGVLNEQL